MVTISHDPEVNILTVRLRAGNSVDSEIKDNVVLDYDATGALIKIDIMDVNLEEMMKSTAGLPGNIKIEME